MNYWVVGKRGLIGVTAALSICIVASFLAANQLGKAVFANADKRVLPIYSVETIEKTLALGFNCAWEDDDVPQILQILKENDVKATFFMVGQWVEEYPQSVKAIYDAGHEMGNHSYSHPDMTSLSREQIRQQIQKCDDAVEKVTGIRPKLFRAPSGAYNNSVVETAMAMGHSAIQWDCEQSHTKSNPQ